MFPTGPKHWTLYVDPATSFLLTMLILGTTLKLLKGTVAIIIFKISYWRLSIQIWPISSSCDDSDANRSARSRLGKNKTRRLPIDSVNYLFSSFYLAFLFSTKYNAVVKLHDLHIWTLAGDQIVGTVHLKMFNIDLKSLNQVNNDRTPIIFKVSIYLFFRKILTKNSRSLPRLGRFFTKTEFIIWRSSRSSARMTRRSRNYLQTATVITS